MKTQEELNTLKQEYETLNEKLAELSEEELEQVTGGVDAAFFVNDSPLFAHGGQDIQGGSVPMYSEAVWTPNYEDENGGAIYYHS